MREQTGFIHVAADGQRDIKVLAVIGVWAMVRRPGCAPYVCLVDEIHPTPAQSHKHGAN